MNFDFSGDQKALGEQLRRALDKASPLGETRRVMMEREPYSRAAWTVLAEAGALGAAIPEAYGGVGAGPLEVCIAAYELGFALASTAYASSFQCSSALLRWGSDLQKEKWLPALASGAAIGTVAFSENGAGIEASAISTVVREGKLYGAKQAVLDAMSADVAVVSALQDGKPLLCVVDLHSVGVTRVPHDCIDPTRPSGDLVFEDAPCSVLQNTGFSSAQEILNLGAVVLAFEQIGAAERALFMARDYALVRKAFGQQIGAYQGIKHKLADMYVKIETARVHAYWGAWAISTNAAELPLAAAGARVMATEALDSAAKENVQVHGGIGFTWEHDCHLFYKRSRAYALALGPALRWKEQIMRQLERANVS